MNTLRTTAVMVVVCVLCGTALPQQKARLGDNAALRYWAAFAQMQDSALTGQQVKELNGILDGSAPYDDSKYKDLVEKNRAALETMARGTKLPNCDWGVEYEMRVVGHELRDDTPADYVRNALALGRLNVLYAFHLAIAHDPDGAARALAAGLRFSRDVANGGTLFATVVAKDLLVTHLRAVEFVSQDRDRSPSAAQMAGIRTAITHLGAGGLDWRSAMKREMANLNRPDWQMSVPLGRVTQAYVAALGNPSLLLDLQKIIAAVPQPLQDVIPNPKRVLEQKQELTEKIQQTRNQLLSKPAQR